LLSVYNAHTTAILLAGIRCEDSLRLIYPRRSLELLNPLLGRSVGAASDSFPLVASSSNNSGAVISE